MSYCRWSSDNWMCDVYVYASYMGCWTIHVAGTRNVIPPLPDLPIHRLATFGGKYDFEARKATYPSKLHAACAKTQFWLAALWHRAHMASVDAVPKRPIGLAYDGETFYSVTAGDCADRLEMLRAAGYRVPQYAIDALRAEQEQEYERNP